jgi:hypothetical protein
MKNTLLTFFLILCSSAAFSQATFVGKTKDTYVFTDKGVTIQATCDFTNRPNADGTSHYIENFCPLALLPGIHVSEDSCTDDPAPKSWLRHKKTTYLSFNTETLWVETDACIWEDQNADTNAEGPNWAWSSREVETVYFKVRSMTK